MIKLTQARKEELEKELDQLITEGRKQIAEEIKTAREFGDLSENAEYDEAKNKQAIMEARITEIEDVLKEAEVVKVTDVKGNKVAIGTKVTVRDEEHKEEVTYTIVGATEANPFEGKISDESPVGKALIGAKKGDKRTVITPAGENTLEVLKIEK